MQQMKMSPSSGKERFVHLRGLKSVRQRKGFSLHELAAESGVEQSMISKLENERRGAQGRTLRKLAEALGVEPDELVG